jgi:hypothetical protein
VTHCYIKTRMLERPECYDVITADDGSSLFILLSPRYRSVCVMSQRTSPSLCERSLRTVPLPQIMKVMLQSSGYQGAAKRHNLKVFIAIDCSIVSI